MLLCAPIIHHLALVKSFHVCDFWLFLLQWLWNRLWLWNFGSWEQRVAARDEPTTSAALHVCTGCLGGTVSTISVKGWQTTTANTPSALHWIPQVYSALYWPASAIVCMCAPVCWVFYCSSSTDVSQWIHYIQVPTVYCMSLQSQSPGLASCFHSSPYSFPFRGFLPLRSWHPVLGSVCIYSTTNWQWSLMTSSL